MIIDIYFVIVVVVGVQNFEPLQILNPYGILTLNEILNPSILIIRLVIADLNPAMLEPLDWVRPDIAT